MAALREQGHEVVEQFYEPDQLGAALRDFDAVVVRSKTKVRANHIDEAKGGKLKLIIRGGVGVDNIDVKYAEANGITVKNTPKASSQSVAELALGHMFACARYISIAGATMREDKWEKKAYGKGVELSGKTLGVIGLGAIGKRVAAVASAFGMKVSYYSPSGTSHCSDYPSIPLDQLMSESDVISVHAPLNERTDGLVGERELALMKPEAIIVNMGRGGIVSEKALADAIDAASIGGAALDVFVKEPLPADSPLLHTAHPELLRLTPHTAWASVEARQRLAHGVAENIRKGW